MNIKDAGTIVAVMAALVGFIWMLAANSLAIQSVFSPKFEQVRRDTFEQSKAYNQGMIQELQNMQFEYIKANEEQKGALRSVILHRAADYPSDKMPEDLNQFIEGLK